VENNPPRLYWNPAAIAKLMRRNKINDRKDLAEAIGQPYTTVCENLASDWSGRVKTFAVLVMMCRTFDVKLAALVNEPKLVA
jgi:hypothetical protein